MEYKEIYSIGKYPTGDKETVAFIKLGGAQAGVDTYSAIVYPRVIKDKKHPIPKSSSELIEDTLKNAYGISTVVGMYIGSLNISASTTLNSGMLDTWFSEEGANNGYNIFVNRNLIDEYSERAYTSFSKLYIPRCEIAYYQLVKVPYPKAVIAAVKKYRELAEKANRGIITDTEQKELDENDNICQDYFSKGVK